MGCEAFRKKTSAQLAKHIQTVAKNSSCVHITTHASKRMRERKVSHFEILDCLKTGTIARPPLENKEKGSLECRVERFVVGRQLAVVVALCDEDPDLVVITVFDIN